jgi:hypothetical protein
MEMLHVCAELEAAGQPAEQQYPGIVAHLRACGPCGTDFDGLLAALRDEASSHSPERGNTSGPGGTNHQ